MKRLPIYAAADAAIARFQDATGLACPPGCGRCCAEQTPFVRVADMEEIAAAHVARGIGEDTLARAKAAGSLHPCVIFEPGRLPGGCTEYELRPTLCRLFGFAAVRDKHGHAALAACRVHKEETPAVAARARDFVDGGGEVPIFAEWQAAADAASDDGDPTLMPINEALAIALERALLRAQYAASSSR